jgi:catalase
MAYGWLFDQRKGADWAEPCKHLCVISAPRAEPAPAFFPLCDHVFAKTEQVAFMTQNVPPGIDFSNDPLLQGRNFSYPDTQLKRLGGPNFTHLPINAPKCPFAHFQQDGHMAMRNPVGRANYQPNSFGEGPRESPQRGFTPFAEVEQGAKRRLRAESFADNYSQARQFFISQSPTEQTHIAAALTFELSKVKLAVIRERMVSHLLNIDGGLASEVMEKLGLQKMPKPTDAAVPTRQDLDPSLALSIVENGPERFEGRKLGILVSDGSDAGLLKALTAALDKADASYEIIAPKITGVEASDGSRIEADQMIDGGPSVLYDAVALLPAPDAMHDLLQESSARDFVADAFAHCKFIGYAEAALPLFEKAGVAAADLDEGCIALENAKGVENLLRAWRLQIKRHTAFVAVGKVPGIGVFRNRLRRQLVGVPPQFAARRLHLDDIRAEVRQDHRRAGTGDEAR